MLLSELASPWRREERVPTSSSLLLSERSSTYRICENIQKKAIGLENNSRYEQRLLLTLYFRDSTSLIQRFTIVEDGSFFIDALHSVRTIELTPNEENQFDHTLDRIWCGKANLLNSLGLDTTILDYSTRIVLTATPQSVSSF